MDNVSDRLSLRSGNSAYLSVGIESDTIEMQDLGAGKSSHRSDNETDTIRNDDDDGDDQQVPADDLTDVETETDGEPGAAVPLLSNSASNGMAQHQQPKQVKFSRAVKLNNESIEMRRTSSQGQNSVEAQNLLTTATTGETNLDEIEAAAGAGSADEQPAGEGDESEGGATSAEAEADEAKRKSRLSEYLSARNQYVRLLKPTKMKFTCLAVSFVILFLVIFLPNCIFSIHYDKMALARNKFTGVVNTKRTYEPGLHFMLPWTEWIMYDKTAISDEINDLTIFTTDKLLIKSWFKIFYFLDKSKLGELYTKFGPNYEDIIMSVSRSELMNAGQQFSIDDYRAKRLKVRMHLKERLAKRLAQDYSVVLFDLYLDKLQFSEEINQLNLKRMLNGIYNEKAVYEKQTVLTREETLLKTTALRNQATLILQTAELEANYTYLKMAQASKDTLLEKTFVGYLNRSYNELSFYDGGAAKAAGNKKLMMSYCWLSSLLNCKGNVTFYVMDKNFVSVPSSAPIGSSPAYPGLGYEGMMGLIV